MLFLQSFCVDIFLCCLLGLGHKSKPDANSLRSPSESMTAIVSHQVHYLKECNGREGIARQDRRKRRYCIGCYQSMAELHGRTVAKMTIGAVELWKAY